MYLTHTPLAPSRLHYHHILQELDSVAAQGLPAPFAFSFEKFGNYLQRLWPLAFELEPASPS